MFMSFKMPPKPFIADNFVYFDSKFSPIDTLLIIVHCNMIMLVPSKVSIPLNTFFVDNHHKWSHHNDGWFLFSRADQNTLNNRMPQNTRNIVLGFIYPYFWKGPCWLVLSVWQRRRAWATQKKCKRRSLFLRISLYVAIRFSLRALKALTYLCVLPGIPWHSLDTT